MNTEDLVARIEQARNKLESARELISNVQDNLNGKDKTPSPPASEKGGMFDGLMDTVREHGHTALDIAGFIPGVGAVADLANAAWYAGEGDYKNAALSAAAAIPGVGDAAAAAKLGARGFEAAQAIRRGAEAVDTAEGVAEGVNQTEQGNFENAGLAFGAAAFGAGGGRGRNSDSGDSGDYNGSSHNPEEPDRYDEYAERYGYGDDYDDPRERHYGEMGRNQRENNQFDAAQREAERRAGREFTRDERQERHHREPGDDGKYRSYGDIVDDFDE